MNSPLQVVYMGTADLAATVFQALLSSPNVQICAAVTQPDKPRGRELKLHPTRVKEIALQENVPVLQPESARSETFLKELKSFKPDLIVVAAYGQILPKSILDLPPLGCLNVHTSLLPAYRGAAPIQFAILNGDTETGVTIMQMDEGMDTGAILTQVTTPVSPEDNAQTLHDRLAKLGGELLVATIPNLANGTITPKEQDNSLATYTRKISKQDGLIDWTQPATTIWNQIRGLTPWPGAFTYFSGSKKPVMLKIWEASPDESLSGKPGTILEASKGEFLIACGKDGLRITTVQAEGRKRMPVEAFLAGAPVEAGGELGQQN